MLVGGPVAGGDGGHFNQCRVGTQNSFQCGPEERMVDNLLGGALYPGVVGPQREGIPILVLNNEEVLVPFQFSIARYSDTKSSFWLAIKAAMSTTTSFWMD